MKQQHFRYISQNIAKIPLATYAAIASSIVLLTTSGCVNKSQNEVEVEIQSIQKENNNGLYKIAGSTNLPESSRIAITAVRSLRLTTANTEVIIDDNGNINRSILARQIVEVKQGRWEADLNLWQVAPNGNFQEVWQLNQDLKKFTPESKVTFIATFNPVAQLPSSDKSSDKQNPQQSTPQFQQLEGESIRFTNEGEKYVQARQFRSIPLPVGNTTPPPAKPEDFNDGWGNRYQIKARSQDRVLPPLTKSEQSNSPLRSSEFLR